MTKLGIIMIIYDYFVIIFKFVQEKDADYSFVHPKSKVCRFLLFLPIVVL